MWLSFRRCRHGVCGVYGEHWGGPEGDAFGRAARRFEEMGVGALAINCIPPDHVTGMLSWLRDFTDLPLGVYPNLGYLSAAGWRHEAGHRRATSTPSWRCSWREEGAQIIGGCCGVGPEHLAAARAALADTKPGHERPAALPDESGVRALARERAAARVERPRGRAHVPARLPRDRRSSDGVFVPTQGSFLVWKYLYREGIGAHQRCLDIGCGTGPADGAARAQRRRPRARDRHRRGGGQEHAHERVSQRRRRPRSAPPRRTCTRGCPRSATT